MKYLLLLILLSGCNDKRVDTSSLELDLQISRNLNNYQAKQIDWLSSELSGEREKFKSTINYKCSKDYRQIQGNLYERIK